MSQPTTTAATFRLAHVARLGSFHIGSAMSDILVSSVWNRVMISDFGLPSWPVSLLLAIRYLLVPVSLWAGFISDRHPIWGLHRSPYIWLGRGLMVLSLPCIALSLSFYSGGEMPMAGWALAAFGFSIYGFGGLMSGSPFIALVRDTTPYEKRGLAMTIVETIMIASFPLAAILFGSLMEHYSSERFWMLTALTMLVGGFFWLFATLGIEKRSGQILSHSQELSKDGLIKSAKEVLSNKNTRIFFFFLSLAAVSAWMQDAILEPFGADVFQFSAGKTTRFSAYWMGATFITLVTTTCLLRKRLPETLSGIASIGLAIMGTGMAGLAVSAWGHHVECVTGSLVLFGAGFGIYTFAGLNLMMVMTTDKNAGLLLGLWTIAQVIARGVGISLGGILRDLFSLQFEDIAMAYACVFGLQALGLFASVLLLQRIDLRSFATKSNQPRPTIPGHLSEAI